MLHLDPSSVYFLPVLQKHCHCEFLNKTQIEQTWEDLRWPLVYCGCEVTHWEPLQSKTWVACGVGCRTEMSLSLDNCSDVQNPDLHHCAFFSKGPNSQREHMQSHETCPRKTATPVTRRDCQCGPLNPQGRSQGQSMGWFNYTRKTLCVCYVYVYI